LKLIPLPVIEAPLKERVSLDVPLIEQSISEPIRVMHLNDEVRIIQNNFW
jgi:hypothetical protein